MRRFFIAISSVLIISALSTSARGFEVALAWDPNTEPDIAGYILYVRENDSGSSYAQVEYYSLDEIDPLSPQCTVTAMESGVTYHFVVTAVNNAGTESGYSNEVSVLNGQAFAYALNSDRGSGCFVSTAIVGALPQTLHAWRLRAPSPPSLSLRRGRRAVKYFSIHHRDTEG